MIYHNDVLYRKEENISCDNEIYKFVIYIYIYIYINIYMHVSIDI